MLPRDLDNADYFGRQHMETLLNMQTHVVEHASFTDLARPFILVMSHPALLDCLTVNASVGSLYGFTSGSNKSRAMSFFQKLGAIVVEKHLGSTAADSKTIVEKLLDVTIIIIRELLRREVRAAAHNDLPNLLKSVENAAQICSGNQKPVAVYSVFNRIEEIRETVARASRLLQEEEEPTVDGVLATAVTSTHPREIILPPDRYDNDKIDFTKINIIPTEDEIWSHHLEILSPIEPNKHRFLTDRAERYLDTLFRLLRRDFWRTERGT